MTRYRHLLFILMLLLLAGSLSPASASGPVAQSPQGTGGEAGVLTLLHNNDGESTLLPLTYAVPQEEGSPVELPVAGVSAYKTMLDQNIAQARGAGHSVMNVYAGDAFLASATLNCSLPPDRPVYDAIAQRQMNYDAHIFGNHEFDFNPDFLLRFIRGFTVDGVLDHPFLSANLDFSGEPAYATLIEPTGLIVNQPVDGRVIARSMLYTDPGTGHRFGIVGATTPILPTISEPRNVTVTPDLETTAEVVQAEIDRLWDDFGVRKFIFVSHLQDIHNDIELMGMLDRVDVGVSGGGDELLLNPAIPAEQQLLPGETQPVYGEYPIWVQDASGRDVPIVTSAGNYKYMGRFDIMFDAEGEVAEIIAESSYPRRIIPESVPAQQLGLADAVAQDPALQETVIAPVAECLEFAQTPIAVTEVLLDVSRAAARSRESNAGNMIADAFLYQYNQNWETNGLPDPAEVPVIAVQNGGGIRQNAGNILPTAGEVPGVITRLDTNNVLPFQNFLTAVMEVTPADIKTIMERSAASLPGEGGQFLQISGFRVFYNYGNPVGNRVINVTLLDGRFLVRNYQVVEDAPSVVVVTNSFTAGGGDNYPTFAENPNKQNIVDENGAEYSYESAWVGYIQSFPVGAEQLPVIPATDARYQPGGEGRITMTAEEPTAVTIGDVSTQQPVPFGWWVAAGATLAGAGALVVRRRRRAAA